MKKETERLILRPIQTDDKTDFFAYRSDTETNHFQSFVPKTIQEVEKFIANSAKGFNQPNTWFQLMIIEKSTNNIVGDIGIHFLSGENKQVEIGCTLSKKIHGKGYATEALKKIFDILFRDFDKHRIIASIDPKNKKSIQLMERIGMRKEAHFVESLLINGVWADDIIYAILQKEWGEKN